MSSEIKVDTISENTSANGVSIDSVTLKDGGVTATAASTITTADNSDTLRLISTDDDANVGPVLVLHRNSASPEDNDIIGNILFSGEDSAGNETDFMRFDCAASDKTNGAEDGQFRIMGMLAGSEQEFIRLNPNGFIFNEGGLNLNFRIESDNRPDIFFVDGGNDKVGVGTDSPQERLHVFDSSTTCNLRVSGENNNNKKVEIGYDASNGPQIKAGSSGINTLKFFVDNTSLAMTIAANDVISGDFNDTSDIALKENIIDLENATEKLKQLKARMFDWKKEDKSKEVAGFIAQEVENIIPSAVVGDDYVETTFYTDDDDIPEDKKVGDTKVSGNSGKAINTSAILAYAVKTIQELEARIKALEDA